MIPDDASVFGAGAAGQLPLAHPTQVIWDLNVRLPDEASALILKVLARTVRNEDRDAVDVWRALEVCQAAGIEDIDLGADKEAVRRVLAVHFSRGGDALGQIRRAQNLSDRSATALDTRIQALIARVLPG